MAKKQCEHTDIPENLAKRGLKRAIEIIPDGGERKIGSSLLDFFKMELVEQYITSPTGLISTDKTSSAKGDPD